jgi:hemerythrin-like domain-containing protein
MRSDHLHVERALTAAAGPATADLRREHEVILGALDILERTADRLAADRPVSDPSLGELVQLLQTFADRCHHGKEEDTLFPAMRAKSLGGMLTVFLEEHEEGRGYLRSLASSSSSAERARAARRYVELLRGHIERENEILFPLADELFTAQEHRALARAYEEVELRVVGPGVHERVLTALARLEAEMSSGRCPS